MNRVLLNMTIVITLVTACSQQENEGQNSFEFTAADSAWAAQYHISNYYDQPIADTLLVNAVTFIGRKPALATSETRFDSEFRGYYIELAKNFSYFLYHISPDSLHSFYMIRPARSLEGTTRGVLGQYRLSADSSIYDFVEILNTRIKTRKELQKIGLMLFEELIDKGNVDAMISDTSLVEWPDGRLKYDTRLNEWRYDTESPT